MNWVSSILVICVFNTILFASDVVVLGDIQISIADSYSGTAFATADSSPDSSPWKRVEFSIGASFLSWEVVQLLPGGRERVLEVRYGDMNESWLFYPSHFQATRNKRFANTLTDAGETDLSPMPIIRMVQSRTDQLEIKKTAESGDGKVTLRVSDSTGTSVGYSEIDILDGRIIEYRANLKNDKFITTVEYGGWIQLPSGKSVPTENISTLWDPGTDSTIIQTIHIENIVENDASYKPAKPRFPASYTVIDHIEGVTKSDGKVIGQDQSGQPSKSKYSSPRSRGKQASQYFIWIGVGFVVVAGVMVGFKLKSRS